MLSKETNPIDLKGSRMFFVKFNDEYVYSNAFKNRFDDDKLNKIRLQYEI